MNNIEELKDWIRNLKNSPDSRFWDIDKMSIFDIFEWLWNSGNLDDDKILFKLVNFIKDNNLIK